MRDFDIEAVVAQVIPIVREAGELVREAFAGDKKITHKGRVDLVTETDIAVEKLLVERLKPLLPDATFLAEESAKDTQPGAWTWIIDPLDGTTNFAHGLPFVANSVALWHGDRVVIGVVNLPILGELFWAAKGMGAHLNDSRISVSEEVSLEKTVIATGFPYAIEEHLNDVLNNLEKLLPIVQGVRRPGAAAMDLAYVAAGRYDGFYESALNPWDTAAGILLVQEAGGKVSERDCEKEYTFSSPNILATNGRVHGDLSRILTEC